MAFELFPVVQWFDNSGLPLAGGLISTFVAGSTTPQATYTDSTGGTPQANPVVLDAAGRAQIWFAAASYKLVLKTAAGVTLMTIDNVTLDNLAATISSLTMTGALVMQQPTAATNVANQSSNTYSLQGTYWNGAASATDTWQIQNVIGAGTNPTSTLTLTHNGSSGAASVSIPSAAVSLGGVITLSGANIISAKNFENIRFADQFAGADWAAKVMAADADLGVTKGEIWVNQSAGTSATTAITLSDDHTLNFLPGTYTTTQPITLGNRNAIVCKNIFNTLVNYTGSAYAIEVNTVTQPTIEIGIQIATTALGAIRFRNSGNVAETRPKGKVYIAATWTSGQVGCLFQATTSTSSVYHARFDVYASNVDIPIRMVSTAVNQGPNGNWIYLESNGHSVAFDIADATDCIFQGMILGCHGLTGGTAFRLGTGSGGYGVANCVLGPFSSEQGGTSTTINVASGAGLTVLCGNSIAIGQSNDSSGLVDANTQSTVLFLQNGGAISNAIIANNILAFGGVRSAASAAIKRNGTVLESRLGDDSAYSSFTGTLFTSNVATGTAPLVVTSTTPVANLTIQKASARSGAAGTAPAVVSVVDLTGQTAAITTTNLNSITLPAGQYRVTWNAKVTTAAGTSSTLGAMTLGWTDPDATSLAITATAVVAAGGTATSTGGNTTTTLLIGVPTILNVKASTNITYAFGYASNAANAMAYNLHITLEAI